MTEQTIKRVTAILNKLRKSVAGGAGKLYI